MADVDARHLQPDFSLLSVEAPEQRQCRHKR